VKYLQTLLIYFYSERLDIVEQAKRLASDLGGRLEVPRLSWKYSWIKAAFGWRTAKRAQLFLQGVRFSFVRYWDKVLFRIENRRLKSDSPK
jgi:hypothetical protein